MAAPPPNAATTSNLLSTHRALLSTISSFLTVCTHHILFLRRIYPPVSFVATRAYNYPVRQNRHPQVCAWINSAVSAITDQLSKNTVEKVALCIFECDTNRVLETWTFDLHVFPSISKRDRDVPFANTDADDDSPLQSKINLADLEANFRAALSRISTSSAKLRALPEGPAAPELSFTLTIEIKDNADRPVGRLEAEERIWIAAEEPEYDSTPTSKLNQASSSTEATKRDEAKTTPVRSLSAGPLYIELWVEESAAKFTYDLPPLRTAADRAKEVSYGAGMEKFVDTNQAAQVAFDPEHGYDDVQGTSIDKKPNGGAGTDYQRERR